MENQEPGKTIFNNKLSRREFLKMSVKTAALFFLTELVISGFNESKLFSFAQELDARFVIPYKPFYRADLYQKHNLQG